MKIEIIYGNVPSKSNSYKIAYKGFGKNRRPTLIKNKVVKDYEKAFVLQLSNKIRSKTIMGFFQLHINVYYKNQASDLDGSFKVILDTLQKVSVIKNDNKCIKIVANKFIDKKEPRIEFYLLEVLD